MSETVTLEVLRYLPETDSEPHFQRYTVPYRDDWVVLDALNHIKDNLDATLSYRWSCHMAVCGSCGMTINNEPKLSCHTFLRDYRGGVIRIEPLDHFPIERDLVIVMDGFMDKLSGVKPWLIPKQEKPLSEGEYLQSPAELNVFHQYTQCINCVLCYAACPQVGLNAGFRRPGGTGAGAPLQSRFPRRRQGRARRNGRQQRGHLGMHLRRRLLPGLPQERRSRRRDPANKDFRVRRLAQGPADAGSASMSRRPYMRKVERSWWLQHPRYVAYMIRELTSLFVGLYCALLAIGLMRLAQGQAAWDGFVAAFSSPPGVVFQLLCLVFAVYHSVTWFALTPKAMPLMVRGEPVPGKLIVGAHYLAWAAVSAVVLMAAGV